MSDLLNELENKEAAKFHDSHRCKKGARKRETTMSINSTGLGLNLVMRCTVCGKEKDVSDYGSW